MEEKSLELLEKACDIDSSCIEKIRIDNDFSRLRNEKRFRIILGL